MREQLGQQRTAFILTWTIAPNVRLEADADATRAKATNSPTNARSFMLGATRVLTRAGIKEKGADRSAPSSWCGARAAIRP